MHRIEMIKKYVVGGVQNIDVYCDNEKFHVEEVCHAETYAMWLWLSVGDYIEVKRPEMRIRSYRRSNNE